MLLVSNLHFLSDQVTPQSVQVSISRSLGKIGEKEAGEQFGGARRFSIKYAQGFFLLLLDLIKTRNQSDVDIIFVLFSSQSDKYLQAF